MTNRESHKYTVETHPKLEARIDQDMQTIVEVFKQLPQAHLFLAAVLLGGYGRGEGTPLKTEGERKPFNDYDLVVIARPMPRWRRQQLQNQLHRVEESLTERLEIPVEIYLHTTDTLKRSPPSLMNIEMKLGHHMLFGDPTCLDHLPYHSLTEVPLDEGTRLLLNRGRLLLEIKQALAQDENADDVRLRKFIAKVYLAFGDCMLLAHRSYDLYYAHKVERLASLIPSIDAPEKEWIETSYRRAVEFKLKGDPTLLFQGGLRESWQRAKEIYIPFFLWYESLRLSHPDAIRFGYQENQAQPEWLSIEAYCQSLLKYPEKGKQLLKAIALNFWLFGLRGAFRPASGWAWLHPRKRLYPALLLLLCFGFQEDQAQKEGLLKQLLGTQSIGSDLVQRFKTLARRLE